MTKADSFVLADVLLPSRFLLGSAGYPSPQVLRDAISASHAAVVTVGLKRQLAAASTDNGFIEIIRASGVRLLPNTAGCRSAREAIALAHMARELLGTHWVKLEVVGDEHTLQPDPFELLEATRQLVKDGFEVFPYCTDDLVTGQRLADARKPARKRGALRGCRRCKASGLQGVQHAAGRRAGDLRRDRDAVLSRNEQHCPRGACHGPSRRYGR